MKKSHSILTLSLLLSFFFNVEIIHAQWATQISPLGNDILGKMLFVSPTEGWIACGASGNLLHTTDAGVNWTVVTPFPNDTESSNPSDIGLTMSWPNETHGWALKTYGNLDTPNGATLYQTTNGGSDWSKKDFPKLVPSVTYSSADLVGTWQMHGLTIDNHNDADIHNSWVNGTVSIDTNGNSSTSFVNSQGQSATRNSLAPIITSKGIISLTNTDLHGFMSADKNTVLYTQSAGVEGYVIVVWQKVNSETVYHTSDLQGMWKLHMIQKGASASWIYGTTSFDNTGSGSTDAYGPGVHFNRDFSCELSSTGVLTSEGTDINGYMSADKKTIFLTQTSDMGYAFAIMQKVNEGTTYTAADMTGIWQLHAINTSNTSSAFIHCQYKISGTGTVSATNMVVNNEAVSDVSSTISISSTGILSGFGSATANGFLSSDKSLGINTLDNGSGTNYFAIYQKDLSSSGDVGLQVQFADNNTGWASVYNFIYGDFKLYKTTNGGANWDVINGVTNPVGGFYYFVDALNGWMFGASSTTVGAETDILHTTDGGLSWTTQATNVGSPHAIHFSDALHGWIVGYNALVMHTVDGGDHWNVLNNLGLDSNAKSKAVFALNANVCFIASGVPNTQGNRIVLKTTNGGSSWTPTVTPFDYDIFNLFYWDESNGWISGDYGQIAHYSINVESKYPFYTDTIFRVYPNPVTDFINIKRFEENAVIQVFDICGRCVLEEVVKENNMVDVRDLSTGIYFLRFPAQSNSSRAKFVKL